MGPKNLNLGIKISISISAVIFAVMMLATYVISTMVERHIRGIHYQAAEELALRYSHEIIDTLNSPLYTARTLALTFNVMKAQGKPDRMLGDRLLKEVLEKNPEHCSHPSPPR
jgi:methyl-accepting chemotaxis protein